MEPTNIKFSRSERKGKKYRVDFKLGNDPHALHFGALQYQQFKDKTPLKLYSYLDHGDKKRRALYYKRHGPETDPGSAKWWSHRYLW